MLTTGEAITTGLRHGANQGSESVRYDEQLRLQAHFFLRQIAQEVYSLAPYWWKHGDGNVAITANTERGNAPANFAHFGDRGQVWLSDRQYPLDYIAPEIMDAQRLTAPGQRCDPTCYTLKQQTVLGIRQIDVWPTPGRNITLVLKNYAKTSPALIDVALAPGVAINAQLGNLTGTYTYRCTFVHPDGETEGGAVSASINPVAQQADITQIPVSESRVVTARKLYRTTGSGSQHKLAATISDNVTTAFLFENVADIDLGLDVPLPAQAVTGLEQYPSDFHEQVFVAGLVIQLKAATRGVPIEMFSKKWESNVRRLWADQRPGRNVAQMMPAYGAFTLPRRRMRVLS